MKIPKRSTFSIASGTSAADLLRILNLENTDYKVIYFESVNSNTGTVTKPVGSTILLDQLDSGADAYVNTIANLKPTGSSPVDAGSNTITVTSFDVNGNYVLSGTPTSFPVALIYVIKTPSISLPNSLVSNRLDIEGSSSLSSGGYTIKDSFIPTLGQTIFALTGSVSLVENPMLFLNGLEQKRNTDYTAYLSVLTWTSIPLDSSDTITIYYT